MIKTITLSFLLAFILISFGLSSFSLNFEDIDIYPVASDDIHHHHLPDDNMRQLPLS